jgi:hypothetical protein
VFSLRPTGGFRVDRRRLTTAGQIGLLAVFGSMGIVGVGLLLGECGVVRMPWLEELHQRQWAEEITGVRFTFRSEYAYSRADWNSDGAYFSVGRSDDPAFDVLVSPRADFFARYPLVDLDSSRARHWLRTPVMTKPDWTVQQRSDIERLNFVLGCVPHDAATDPRLVSFSNQVRRVARTEGAFYSYVYKSNNPENVSFYLVVPGERLIFEIWCKV